MLSLGTGARGSREGMSMEMNKAQALPLMSLQSRRDKANEQIITIQCV